MLPIASPPLSLSFAAAAFHPSQRACSLPPSLSLSLASPCRSYDVDNSGALSDQDFIGEVNTTVGELMGVYRGRMTQVGRLLALKPRQH